MLRMHLLEPRAVELAGDALEAGSSVIWRAISASQTLSRSCARPLVERGFGDQLAEQLPVEAQRPRLVRRDRAAELAAELLQPVLVELAELVDADFGAADLGDRRRAEARKMSPMPQMPKLMAIRPRTTPMTARPIQLAEAL